MNLERLNELCEVRQSVKAELGEFAVFAEEQRLIAERVTVLKAETEAQEEAIIEFIDQTISPSRDRSRLIPIGKNTDNLDVYLASNREMIETESEFGSENEYSFIGYVGLPMEEAVFMEYLDRKTSSGQRTLVQEIGTDTDGNSIYGYEITRETVDVSALFDNSALAQTVLTYAKTCADAQISALQETQQLIIDAVGATPEFSALRAEFGHILPEIQNV